MKMSRTELDKGSDTVSSTDDATNDVTKFTCNTANGNECQLYSVLGDSDKSIVYVSGILTDSTSNKGSVISAIDATTMQEKWTHQNPDRGSEYITHMVLAKSATQRSIIALGLGGSNTRMYRYLLTSDGNIDSVNYVENSVVNSNNFVKMYAPPDQDSKVSFLLHSST